mgnify:CR=1 FL=1
MWTNHRNLEMRAGSSRLSLALLLLIGGGAFALDGYSRLQQSANCNFCKPSGDCGTCFYDTGQCFPPVLSEDLDMEEDYFSEAQKPEPNFDSSLNSIRN